MYQVNVVLATPDKADDEDFVWTPECADKKALHKLESSFIHALLALSKLTEHELQTGKKPFPPSDDRTLVTFTVDISKDGADYGGYAFRWPNQTPEAIEYLRGMGDGLMKETGHAHTKQRKPKK